MISPDQAIAILAALEAAGVQAWVDGGWGVDALLGTQTRPHDDLDLVVPAQHVPAVEALLAHRAFRVERDWRPTALALRHPDGRGVDLHPVEPSADGGGDQVLADGSRWHYDAPVAGLIAGQAVRCCSVETQLAAHLGYEADENDRADVARLVARFGCELLQLYTESGRAGQRPQAAGRPRPTVGGAE